MHHRLRQPLIILVSSITFLVAVAPFPVFAQASLPLLASAYQGTVHNITFDRTAPFTLSSIVQNQDAISGNAIIGPGLNGSGSFTGTIMSNRSVSFTDVSTDGSNVTIFFIGSLYRDGSLSGTYTIPSTEEEGTWQAAPSPTIDLQTVAIQALQPLLANSNPTFRATIRNNGSAASGNFNIRWIADGKIFDGGHYSIPAGATDTHDHIWSNITSGQHTLTFIANFDHGIPESNYDNNQFTLTFTAASRNYDPGNYGGKSSFVSVGHYNEPNQLKYVNYCGPGASQVLISAWTSKVSNIDTLATQEKTNPYNGTFMSNMVEPVNKAIGQNYYSIQYAKSQGDFSNMIGRDILNNNHPLITGILTIYGTNHLNGWNHVKAMHIVTIYGFDFTSPSIGYVYYYETAGTVSGATNGPSPEGIDYNTFWTLVQQNSIQLA